MGTIFISPSGASNARVYTIWYTQLHRSTSYLVSSLRNGMSLIELTDNLPIFPRSLTASFLMSPGRHKQQNGVMLAALV